MAEPNCEHPLRDVTSWPDGTWREGVWCECGACGERWHVTYADWVREGKEDGDDWQAIATAPKTGEHILAYSKPLGIRVTNNTNPPTVVHWWANPGEEGFYTSVNDIAPERPFPATHWMPLPEPPK